MKTFLEYVEQREIYNYFSEIISESQDNEELNQMLIQEGFWDALGNIGRSAGWLGTKGFQGIKRGVGELFKGASQGIKSANAGASWNQRDQTNVAQLEINNAIESLKKAISKIKDDSETTDGKNLKHWLNNQVEWLTKQLPQV